MAPDVLATALELEAQGISVIPIRADRSKAPALKWKSYQSCRADPAQIRAWFTGTDYGLGVVCGEVSGHLEMLELEGRATTGDQMESLYRELEARGVRDVWDRIYAGYSEWTPYGGFHLFYRMEVNPPGNTKLANEPGEDENGVPITLTLSETRGEGGYVIVAPSGGMVHPTSEPWMMISGGPSTIVDISWDERQLIHAAITAALDRMPKIVYAPTTIPAPRAPSAGERPGDEFIRTTPWANILKGWTPVSQHGNEVFWVRPGKNPNEGHSASTREDGCLWVWSTSAGLPTDEPLTKLFVYAHYEHNGNMSAAASALRKQGMGSVAPPAPRDDFSWQTDKPKQNAPQEAADGGDGGDLGPVERPDIEYHTHEREWDDIGNAKRLKDRFGHLIRWVESAGTWAVYKGGRWQLDEMCLVDHMVMKMLDAVFDEEKHCYSEEPGETATGRASASERDRFRAFVTKSRNAQRMAAVSKVARALPGMAMAITDFDQHPDLLNCLNGIIDLRTGELLPEDRSMYLMQQAGAEYHREAAAPRWEKFLSQVLPDLSMADYLQRITGYSLSGSIKEQAMFIHNGVGANGKSVYLDVMSHVTSDYGQTMPRSTLLVKQSESHPTEIARMMGVRFLQTSETAPGRRLDEEVVKQLTGGERVTARFMNKNFFDFKPTGKIHYVTNHLPRMTDAASIWRRTHLVMWDVSIPEDEQDKDLAEKIIRDEASGVLAWAVRGAVAWYQYGLHRPSKARFDLDEYRSKEDLLGEFIDTCLLIETVAPGEEPAVVTPTMELFNSYRRWANDSGIERPWSVQIFSNAMAEKGFDRGRTNSQRYFRGISVLPPVGQWIGGTDSWRR